MAKSAQQFETSLLTAKIASLEKRLAVLESRFAGFDDNAWHGLGSDTFPQKRYGYQDEDDADSVEAAAPLLARGRNPRIPRERLAERRDDLVHFIELRWPDLQRHFGNPVSLERLVQALKDASPGADTTPAFWRLVEHIADLWEFLGSGRYKRDPRQIAYAMAGVPEMTWRSSFDYCTKHPSPLHITLPAFVDHIKRRNPECLRALRAQGPTPEALRLLRRCCSECKRLASKPARVMEALQVSGRASTAS